MIKMSIYRNNHNNNNNRKSIQYGHTIEEICMVSECFFTNKDVISWWFDSGATHHIVNTKFDLIQMTESRPRS